MRRYLPLWVVLAGFIALSYVQPAQARNYQKVEIAEVDFNDPTVTVVTSSISIEVSAENIGRKYLVVQNKGAVSIYCAGITTTYTAATTNDVEIIAGGNWEFNVTVPGNAIECIAASGNNTVVTVDGSKR